MELPASTNDTNASTISQNQAEANQLRSRYLGTEEPRNTDNNNATYKARNTGATEDTENTNLSSDTGRSYGILAHWKSRSQRVSSSFAVADSVEKKMLKGLVIDDEPRGTKLETLFDVLLAFPVPLKRPRCCGKTPVVRGLFISFQVAFLVFYSVYVMWESVQTLMCQNENFIVYQCPIVQNALRASNLTVTSNVDEQIIQLQYRCDVNDCSDFSSSPRIGGLTANHSNYW